MNAGDSDNEEGKIVSNLIFEEKNRNQLTNSNFAILYRTNSQSRSIEESLLNLELGNDYNAIFIDLHGEATSEKVAIANYFDGKVSAIVGTHTHVPTSDARILPNWTAFQTDAGMCGNYDSGIGMEKSLAIDRFFSKKSHLRVLIH